MRRALRSPTASALGEVTMLGVDFAADQGVLDIIVSWFR